MIPSRGVCFTCRASRRLSTQSQSVKPSTRQFSALSAKPSSTIRHVRSSITPAAQHQRPSLPQITPQFQRLSQSRFQSTSTESFLPDDPPPQSPEAYSLPAIDGQEAIRSAAEGTQDVWYAGYLADQLGGFGWGPTSLVQWLLEHVHIYGPETSLSASIIITALVIRLATFPLVMKASNEGTKLRNIKHLMDPINARMKQAGQQRDRVAVSKVQYEASQLRRTHNIKMRKLAYPFVQAFIGFGSWRLLRNMADLPIPAMETGGLAWFPNLCIADPTYSLPLAMAVCQHLSFRFGGEMGANQDLRQSMQGLLRYGLPTLSFVVVSWAPAAIQLSFCVASFLVLCTSGMMRQPAIRRMLGLVAANKVPAASAQKKQPLTLSGSIAKTNLFLSNCHPKRIRANLVDWQDRLAENAAGTTFSTFAGKTRTQAAKDQVKERQQAVERKRLKSAQSEMDQDFQYMRNQRKERRKY